VVCIWSARRHETPRNGVTRCETKPLSRMGFRPESRVLLDRPNGLGDWGSPVQIRPSRRLEPLATARGSSFLKYRPAGIDRPRVPLWVPLHRLYRSIPFDSVGSLYISRRLVHILEQECGPAVDRID
jgi:hypothetical protein